MARTPDQDDPSGETQPGSTLEKRPAPPPVARPPARPPTGVGAPPARPPARPAPLPPPSNPAARAVNAAPSPRPATAPPGALAGPPSRQTPRPQTAPRNPAAAPRPSQPAMSTSAPAPQPQAQAPQPPPAPQPHAHAPQPAHGQKAAFGGAANPQKGPASVELPPGTLFAGKYRIEKQLGKGGMGAVYLANQELLNRRVAIKLLHLSSDEVTAARFQREARVIAQCQHPNIVNLIDFGEDDGRLFLVMEYIDGLSLTELIKREAPFSAKRVCDIGVQIAEALATAHDINVIHRDLKPDNVMVISTAGRRDYVKILDFGVAKIKRDPSDAQNNTVETKAGLIVGSLRYISPEQVESGDITTRTDMYSFGCVLFEMLAGRRVFEYPSPADCAIAHLTEPPKPPVVQGAPVEGPLVDFIMQCLEKKPERRPMNGRIAAQVLHACRDNPVKAPPPPSEMPTLALAESLGYEALQASKTMPAAPLPPLRQGGDAAPAQGLRFPTVTAHNAAPPAAHAPLPPAAPPSAPAPRPTPSGPDAQLRPARPAGAEGFAIVGGNEVGHTATHLDGVRLAPRAQAAPPPPKKSLLWLWIVLVLVVGGGVATLLVLQPWAAREDGPRGETPTLEAAGADVVGAETRGGGASATPATAAGGEDAAAGGEDAAAPAEDVAVAEDAAPEVAAVALEGVEIVSVPEAADISIANKVVGQTPYTVQWTAEEPPPIVRVSRKGYVDVDLQLVKSDRGTQRRVELRPLDYR